MKTRKHFISRLNALFRAPKATMQFYTTHKGIIYSTNTDSDDVSVVDLNERKEIARIPIGKSPRGSVRITPDGKLGYVCNTANNSISVLDLDHYKEISRILVGLAPRGIVLSPDGEFGFVSNSGADYISVVNLLAEKEIDKISVGSNPRHLEITPDGKKILAAIWGEDKIAVIESDVFSSGKMPRNPFLIRRIEHDDPYKNFPNNNIPTAYLKFINLGDKARPYSLAVSKNAEKAFVANTQTDYITVVDLANGIIEKNIIVGHGAQAILINPNDTNEIFVSIEDASSIVVIDVENGRVKRSIAVGPAPQGIAFSADTKWIAAASFSRTMATAREPQKRNALTIVDREDGKFVDEICVGLEPCSVSLRPVS